jgi:metal-responsive CopG/Arc/MetJ family transcriptional regulator
MNMKAVQITMDEALIDALDRDPQVAERGRSAVVREAVKVYLARRRDETIASAYRRGYKENPATEFDDWAAQGVWPEK